MLVTRMFTHTGQDGGCFCRVEFAKQIALIEAGKQKPQIHVGNLDSMRTWADVRDAVAACVVGYQNPIPGECYNIGGDFSATVGDMLSAYTVKRFIGKRHRNR